MRRRPKRRNLPETAGRQPVIVYSAPILPIAATSKNGVDYAGTNGDKQRHGIYLQSARGQQEQGIDNAEFQTRFPRRHRWLSAAFPSRLTLTPCRQAPPNRSGSARSTAIPACPPSPFPTVRAGNWRSRKSTPRAGCWAGGCWKSSRATTPASRTTRSASPTSWCRTRRSISWPGPISAISGWRSAIMRSAARRCSSRRNR